MRKAKPMQTPGWLKPGLYGAVAGAIAITVVGFSQFGWMTDGNAQQLAQERADAAVVTALVPFCIAKARQDPDPGMLAKFQAEKSSYSRNDLVRTAGWATLGDGKSPDNALARACSDKLHAMKAG